MTVSPFWWEVKFALPGWFSLEWWSLLLGLQVKGLLTCSGTKGAKIMFSGGKRAKIRSHRMVCSTRQHWAWPSWQLQLLPMEIFLARIAKNSTERRSQVFLYVDGSFRLETRHIVLWLLKTARKSRHWFLQCPVSWRKCIDERLPNAMSLSWLTHRN